MEDPNQHLQQKSPRWRNSAKKEEETPGASDPRTAGVTCGEPRANVEPPNKEDVVDLEPLMPTKGCVLTGKTLPRPSSKNHHYCKKQKSRKNTPDQATIGQEVGGREEEDLLPRPKNKRERGVGRRKEKMG
ncbi:hypothetical protein CJ030_MR1G023377 [Morella rubra]|uniref:Uncharacterized protein n=1 Tax=Morella rubra TaxID=262757 RepID=A0A6A1WPT4_9ROSI|nr:hypothetical protein CJ030_MR1G023377 [Morella rubra]